MKPGPVPKDPEERLRRNKTGEDGIEPSSYQLDSTVVIPTRTFQHPTVQLIWVSLKKSVNVKFFEPVDWAYAILALEQWEEELRSGTTMGAMKLQALTGMLERCLIIAADRRKLRIEADRSSAEKEKKTKASDFYRNAFNEQAKARGQLHLVLPDKPDST
jgi:hypothetical protein